MSSSVVQEERILSLNQRDRKPGRYILYWMQQSQRAGWNHALEYAIEQANEANTPVLVVVALMDDYPEANLRHYHFMIQGLRETQRALETRNIAMIVRRGDPCDVVMEFSADAVMIVCDRGYLRHQRDWRETIAERAPCRVIEVESDVVVPVETASEKAEYAARTLRPRIHRHLDRFLVPLETLDVEHSSLNISFRGCLELGDVDALCAQLMLDRTVMPVPQHFTGGTAAAECRLAKFIAHRLGGYEMTHNLPEEDQTSGMSPYLHFGQISPLYVALEIRAAAHRGSESVDTYLEELIVRRELACNFVHYTENYDAYAALPAWARTTLRAHQDDRRAYVYSMAEFEDAATHDRYWNAAMNEMRYTGFMHNYMRMYWGKKILEWTERPDDAFRIALTLNNKYLLDGRDPNSFANVAWLFGLHDRPWQRRNIFGTVRYMNARGLERKCDIQAYVERVRRLTEDV